MWQYPHSNIEDNDALEYCKNIIPMLKAVQNARVCVWIYLTIGYSQACKGDYMASIASFEEGLKFAEETGEALNRAKILNWLGWIYSDLGWISKGRELNQQSYQATTDFGSGGEEAEANAIVNLAENDVAESKFEEAQTRLKDLLKKAETDPGYLLTRHRWEVRLCCTLGEVWLYKNETKEALNCAKKALLIAERTLNARGIIRAKRLMGDIYLKRNELSRAEESLNSALALAEEVGNPPLLWKTDFTMGRLKEVQGFSQEAKRYYEEALNVIKRLSSKLWDKELRDTLLNSYQVTRIRDSLGGL